jgi:hypothetical protein
MCGTCTEVHKHCSRGCIETGSPDHAAVYPNQLYCKLHRCTACTDTSVYCCGLPVLLWTACVLRVYRRVQACVMERLGGYPSLAQQQLQRTALWLPRRLGVLLQVDPQQVSAAVAAFMTRWVGWEVTPTCFLSAFIDAENTSIQFNPHVLVKYTPCVNISSR